MGSFPVEYLSRKDGPSQEKKVTSTLEGSSWTRESGPG